MPCSPWIGSTRKARCSRDCALECFASPKGTSLNPAETAQTIAVLRLGDIATIAIERPWKFPLQAMIPPNLQGRPHLVRPFARRFDAVSRPREPCSWAAPDPVR